MPGAPGSPGYADQGEVKGFDTLLRCFRTGNLSITSPRLPHVLPVGFARVHWFPPTAKNTQPSAYVEILNCPEDTQPLHGRIKIVGLRQKEKRANGSHASIGFLLKT